MTLKQYIEYSDNRKFRMIFFNEIPGSTGEIEHIDFSLSDEVSDNPFEWQNSLQDDYSEDMLKLKKGETMFFQMDRDYINSRAVIMRIE